MANGITENTATTQKASRKFPAQSVFCRYSSQWQETAPQFDEISWTGSNLRIGFCQEPRFGKSISAQRCSLNDLQFRLLVPWP